MGDNQTFFFFFFFFFSRMLFYEAFFLSLVAKISDFCYLEVVELSKPLDLFIAFWVSVTQTAIHH